MLQRLRRLHYFRFAIICYERTVQSNKSKFWSARADERKQAIGQRATPTQTIVTTDKLLIVDFVPLR